MSAHPLLAADNGLSLILLGLAILAIGFALRRARYTRGRADRLRSDTAAAGETEPTALVARIQSMEARLYEYGRETEGRLQTRLAMLERLIVDADERIDRLERLLKASPAAAGETNALQQGLTAATAATPEVCGESTGTSCSERDLPEPDSHPTDEMLSDSQRRMIRHLAGAGFRIEEIARCTGQPVERIAAVLRQSPADGDFPVEQTSEGTKRSA